jgi:hypothetical protein
MKTTITNLLKVIALLGVFVSPAAFAGDEGAATDSEGWAPVKHLRFSDEDIQGGVTDPDGDLIESVPPATHASLIEIRQGFEAELVKTMENF